MKPFLSIRALETLLLTVLTFFTFTARSAIAFDRKAIELTFPRWEMATNALVLGANIGLSFLPSPAPSFGPPAPGSLDYKIHTNHANLDHDRFATLSDALMYPLLIVPPVTYLAANYLPPLRIRSPDLKFLAFLEAMNFTQLVTMSSKKLIGRERPNGTGTESFFSDHASSSFAAAAFFSWDVSDRLSRLVRSDAWIGLRVGARALPFMMLYTAAGLVSYYRIAADKHFFSDVVVGGAVGALCGNFFYLVHFHPDGTPRRNAQEPAQVYPLVEPDLQGLGIAWRF